MSSRHVPQSHSSYYDSNRGSGLISFSRSFGADRTFHSLRVKVAAVLFFYMCCFRSSHQLLEVIRHLPKQ